MKEKTIGILGGMGPEATLDCFAKIIKNTPAKRDQDHLRVIIDSNPKVPDRPAAITGKGESPVPALVQGCRCLQLAGADFIIIPCVAAHFFLEEIRQQVKLPILSIFDVVTETIVREHPQITTVGLLAITATISSGLFQKRLAADNIKTVVPDETGPVQGDGSCRRYQKNSTGPFQGANYSGSDRNRRGSDLKREPGELLPAAPRSRWP